MVDVLITGASGFIGSGVLAYMLEHTNWNFTCVSSWRHKGSPLNLPLDDRVTVITHDLTGHIPNVGTFDYILNLASESHVDRSLQDPVNFIENNVSSTIQMLEYARRHSPKMFIQFSTDEVFGAREHKEWDVLHPTNPYSASKAAQEMIAISYWHAFNVPVVITNSNNIVGPNQDREKFLPKLIHTINAGEKVSIHVSRGMPGRRFYNPVQNVAHALLHILSNCDPFAEDDRPCRYNLPGGQELNNLDLAQLVAELMDRTLHYRIVDVDSIRPGYDVYYAKTDGELQHQGWEPIISLEEALPDIIDSYLRTANAA